MSSKNQEKNDTPVNRPVDKIFAENLGYTFGGCVRDLSGSLFNKEVAKAAGVSLCPIPLLGGEEKRRFKAFWAANLQVHLGSPWNAALTFKKKYRSSRKP